MQVGTSQSIPSAPFNPVGAGSGMSESSLGKEDFMRLLVAQLANQDPLNPTDSTAFTAQLAQFSSLEQLVNVNRGLEMLAITQTAATSAQVMGFIGKEIEFSSDTVHISGLGGGDVRFDLSGEAQTTSIAIRDENGKLVRTVEAGPQPSGLSTVAWDGKNEDGVQLGAGTYTFSITAKGQNGESIAAGTRSKGVVKGVVFDKGYPELMLEDGRKVRLGDVFGAQAPSVSQTPLPTDADTNDEEQS